MTTSPLHEMIAGLRLLMHGPAPERYAAWAAQAAPALPRVSPLHVYRHPRCPAVFAPAPRRVPASLGEQLESLRATTPAALARGFPDGVPRSLRAFGERGGFGALADALETFWAAAMAAYWPGMRAALEAEIQVRSRVLVLDGPAAMLASLPGGVPAAARRQRVLLLPMIFPAGAPAGDLVPYPVAGAPAPIGPAAADRLASLLGPARARILRSLGRPATTTALAAALGYAPSSVSAQLTILVDGGLATRRRVGRTVRYDLQPAGRALLTWLDGT